MSSVKKIVSGAIMLRGRFCSMEGRSVADGVED